MNSLLCSSDQVTGEFDEETSVSPTPMTKNGRVPRKCMNFGCAKIFKNRPATLHWFLVSVMQSARTKRSSRDRTDLWNVLYPHKTASANSSHVKDQNVVFPGITWLIFGEGRIFPVTCVNWTTIIGMLEVCMASDLRKSAQINTYIS